MFSRVAELTDINDHNEALIVAAGIIDTIGALDIQTSLIYIRERHLELGYMRSDLIDMRYTLYSKLKVIAERVLTPVQYEDFYNAL